MMKKHSYGDSYIEKGKKLIVDQLYGASKIRCVIAWKPSMPQSDTIKTTWEEKVHLLVSSYNVKPVTSLK